MKIETEIKQRSFKSDHQKLIVNLIYTGSWINLKSHEALKSYKLTNQQYNILRILKGQHPNPATVNLLIDRMMDKMSNASRIVDKLVDKKLVERKTKADDRRCVDVMITNKGINLLEKIEKDDSLMDNKLKTLSIREVKQLNDLLDKLRG